MFTNNKKECKKYYKFIYIFMNNKYFKKNMVVIMEINICQMCL